MNTCRGILVIIGLAMSLAACDQPNPTQASTQRSQAGVVVTQPVNVNGGGGAGGY